MMNRMTLGTVGLAALTALAPVHAEEVWYGDADGFGFGAPQDVDGALWRDDFGGTFFTDYREADDLADGPQTDIWDSNFDLLGHPWTMTTTTTGQDATLRIYIAGVADVGAVNLLVDGDVLAVLDFPGLFQTTHVLEYTVPAAYIDGSTTFQLDHFTGAGDGYIMDYALLSFEGLSISYDGTCPGSARVSVTGAKPGATLGLLFAAGPGNFVIPPSLTCGGTQLGLSNVGIQLVTTGVADANGEFIFSGNTPAASCGGAIQVIQTSDCATSNVETIS